MKTNYPEDDANTIYLLSTMSWTVEELIETVREKWGDEDFSNVHVRAEQLHTRCLSYDLRDPMDYDDYLILERIER